MSDKNKQPKQTTVKRDDDAITSRELTPEETERIRGGMGEDPGMATSQIVYAE